MLTHIVYGWIQPYRVIKLSVSIDVLTASRCLSCEKDDNIKAYFTEEESSDIKRGGKWKFPKRSSKNVKVHSQVVYLRYIFFGIVNRDTFIQMKFLRIYIQMTLFHILFTTLIRLLKIHEFIQMYHNYSENSLMRFKYLNKLFFVCFVALGRQKSWM